MNGAARRVLGVIPVRLESKRLAFKPLADICGKPLVQRVWECASEVSSLNRLVIATDSGKIVEMAESFGAEVLMTSSDISTGTQRVAEVCSRLGAEDWDVVVNIQGDMPFLPAELVDRLVEFHWKERDRFSVVTAATPILSEEIFVSPSDVKVIVGAGGEALYFSRAPIPFSREGDLLEITVEDGSSVSALGLKHLGLYVFRPDVLEVFSSSRYSSLEAVERLEQLRLLERGFRLGVCVVSSEIAGRAIDVDTPADLELARAYAERNKGLAS